MSIHWDQTTCNIINQTGAMLTVGNVPNLEHGEYGTFPSPVPTDPASKLAFMVQSLNASEIGPVGSLSYSLPDGSSLNISFDQEFAVLQTSHFTAAVQGGRAGAWTVSLDCSWETWHGQGARWTVNLTVSPGQGNTAAECHYTR